MSRPTGGADLRLAGRPLHAADRRREGPRFTGGTRWDATPRFSPDGRRVLFASDPSGSDQLWVIPVEGGTPTMITKEGNYRFGAPSTGGGYQYGSPSWDPSGQFIFTAREALPGSRLGNT